MDKDKVLDEIFANDPFDILEVKPKKSNNQTTDERLLASFNEINDFIKKFNKEPEPNSSNVGEYQLYSRLKNLREDKVKIEMLKEHDIYNLLLSAEDNSVNESTPRYKPKKEINSLEDIFEDEAFKQLSNDSVGLFKFEHTPKHFEREEADFVARRKPCKNFDDYKDILRKVQAELKDSKRFLIQFKQDNLSAGDFYVHNGVLLYLESVDFVEEKQEFKSGSRYRKDGRTRCIFENGTESQMLYRSLYKILLENGYAVTNTADKVGEDFQKNFSNITAEDIESGYIYVLQSKSNNEKISKIKDLYKIGYSNIAIEERIKNAEKEPTYLMAPVKLVSAFRTYNMNTQKFEQLLHNFFGKVCLNFDIYDDKGRRHSPREWFLVPLDIIERTIELIISGEIMQFRYDEVDENIVKKKL